MKGHTQKLLHAIRLLTSKPAEPYIEQIGIKQASGECNFVTAVTYDAGDTILYAASSDREVWHMIPVEEIVAIEASLKNLKHAWFKDAPNLPAILAKLEKEGRAQ